MITKLNSLNKQILGIVVLLFCLTSQAQSFPFFCDYDAYLFQYNDVYSIDLASGNSYLVASDVTNGNINATAYNATDGFIWGSVSTPAKTIVRIGQDFVTTSFYVDELPLTGRYIGDINQQGIYYLKGGGVTYYKVDLNPNSPTYSQYLSTETLSQNISIHDWAFNAVDGNLYAVEKNSNILYRINPITSQVDSLGEVPVLSGLSYTYGAVYFDASGQFYVSANQTGTIYAIQSVQDLNGTNTIVSKLFAFGPSSASNDGARCATAPVPQEICDNGIDDDFDGLIDCEDPSCASFGNCINTAPPTTANAGGLESNGRLSQAINKRNFNRAKSNYKFNQNTARRVTKASNAAQRTSFTGFQLQDFVPLTTINEDFAIDSTPLDLLNITNATEVYSLDYMQNGASIASVLALKTENGVYEHTKYICDRLLGAELITVSTMDINGETFIKSIIKNADGSFEYVLSLSAKVENNDANFAIESHWNLDQYEENKTFYNFQIWSDSIDNLYLLSEEVLNLLNTEKTISSYQLSTPPTVFVRKGQYTNGALNLQIINTNATSTVTFDSGFRVTETSDFNYNSSSINLNGNYITNITVPTGHLFDVGFRIGDGVNTPDDLFMSDGPWGIDDAQPTTTVINYTVSPNTVAFESNDFPIERNINLLGTTSTYLAAYRALTPRFKSVNLTDYNSFKLKAEGIGNLQITFVKESISNWEVQHKTTIALTENQQEFTIPFSDFVSTSGQDLVLDDIVTIVFTMVSEDGMLRAKMMNLQNIRFSNSNTLMVNTFENELTTLTAIPNPMTTSAIIKFKTNITESLTLSVYDQLGKQVKQIHYQTVNGKNEIKLNRDTLSTGLYFCKITSASQHYKTIKLLIR